MKFSTKSEYGLRALISLAKHQKEQPFSLAKIAKEQKISLAYLERLFAKLKKANLVKSAKGMKGGYSLAKPVSKISVKEILIALEGKLSPYICSDLNNICKVSFCSVKVVWQKLENSMNKTLESIKLSDLIK
ncbi:MAG: Rrf2 family transcriptional regulator [Candidatus Parcubacteria bacterium]|nr:Rrf2 family transcriptional regulator [Candidatus Parcubacteria bacterium]